MSRQCPDNVRDKLLLVLNFVIVKVLDLLDSLVDFATALVLLVVVESILANNSIASLQSTILLLSSGLLVVSDQRCLWSQDIHI
jgi:hypothetical protein